MTTTNNTQTQKGGNDVKFANAFEMAQHLIAQGGDPNVSMQLAMETFAKQSAATETTKAPATRKLFKSITPAEAAVQQAKNEDAKPWFKKAVESMNVFKKNELEGRLVVLKLQEKDPKVKAEIEAELTKLRSDKGEERFAKMKEYIAATKNWTIDASGKVADGMYLVGDYSEKAGTGITKITGKAIKVTGEAIVKTGAFIEGNAESVGKAARMPADFVGDTINTLNGNNKATTKKDIN